MGEHRASRCLDVAVSLAALMFLSPVLAVCAALIKLADGGPVVYRQTRVGKAGVRFAIVKLRTMTVGAEHQGAGLVVAAADARITRPGRWLRATSLDEIPQLWNVLRGDMAIVGPRPTVPSQVERYTDHQRRRLDVLPGITGWAQVNGRNSLAWEDRIELDLWYVEHKSLWLDLKVIARTPKALAPTAALYGPDGVTRDLQPPQAS